MTKMESGGRPRVLVRGAGVAGLTSAVTLAERGADVVLLELGG
ncbi:MAG: FAD-binding protein, partial [Gluconacetobacter sp.]